MTQKAKAHRPLKVCGECYWFEKDTLMLNACGCKDSDHYGHMLSKFEHPGCESFRDRKR